MKQILLLSILMLTVGRLSSQSLMDSTYDKTISFGIGYSSYTIYGSQVDLEASYPGSDSYVERRTGIRLDLAFRQRLNSILFIQEGASYVQKGGKNKNTGFVDPARVENNYLQVPILLGVELGSENVLLSLAGGLAVNLEMSSGSTTNGSGWFSDSYKSREIIPSVIIQPSLEILLNSGSILYFGINYDQDLAPLIERSLSGKDYNLKIKGTSFIAGLKWGRNK